MGNGIRSGRLRDGDGDGSGRLSHDLGKARRWWDGGFQSLGKARWWIFGGFRSGWRSSCGGMDFEGLVEWLVGFKGN